MVNSIDKIGEQIFNFNFWMTYEHPIRKSVKRVGEYMDEAIDSLEKAMAECPDDDFEDEEEFAVRAVDETKVDVDIKQRNTSTGKLSMEYSRR